MELPALQNSIGSLPFYGAISQQRRSALELDYASSSMSVPIQIFMNMAFSLCAAVSILAFALLALAGFHAVFSASLSVVLFCALCFFALLLPRQLSSSHAKSVEGELPMLLGELSVYLKLRMPFEKAILEISRAGYKSSPVFSKALRSINAGSSVQGALLEASRSVRSRFFMRAAQQLIVEYEEGSSGDALSMLSEEISQAKAAQARENGSKAALFGLFYISCAALLPSFFSILAIASSAMPSPMSEFDIWLFFLVACPAANAVCLLLIRGNSPEHPPNAPQGAKAPHAPPNAASLFFIACGAVLAYLSVFSSIGILAGISVAALPHASYGISSIRAQGREEALDSELPLALMAASSQARGFSIEKALATMEKSSSGPLAEELSAITRQANSGVVMQQALAGASAGRGSWLFGRAMSILLSAYRSGSAMSSAVRHTSVCMLSMLSLIQERRAAMSMQRYTLLFSCIAVPAIIASVMSVSGEISSTLSSMPEGFFMQPQEGAARLAAASLSAAQIYLAIFALLTAAFIWMQEGRRGAFAFYLPLLLALSQGAFIAALSAFSVKIS